MQRQCLEITTKFSDKIKKLTQDVMDVLRLVYPHIGWNFHVNETLDSYDHFERFLIVSPKSLDQLKLGSQQFLMWIFWTYNYFYQVQNDAQCPWISIQCPNFGKKKILMHCYVFDVIKFMNVVKLVAVQNMGFGKHERIFLTLMFMKTILQI